MYVCIITPSMCVCVYSNTTLFVVTYSFLPELSRYRREFREISFIANGGFGKVYKARHRLDGIDYAIKKIAVTSSHADTWQQHLNEVQTLAKLNHANIVSYKAAWIEVAKIEVPFLCSPLKGHKSHNLHTSNYTEESKSDNFHSSKDSYSNGNSLYNNSKIYHLIRKIIATDMYTDVKVKQQSRRHGNISDFKIRQNISERFEELNSSIDITEEQIVEDNVAKHTDETYSDIVSFRNSKKSKNSNQTKDSSNYIDRNYLCEASTSQKICTYTSDEVSR